jgi:hypothetical protein
VADLDRDGDLDVAATSFADSTVAWFENRGGQAAMSTEGTAPDFMMPDDRKDVLRITVTHRGRSGDSPVEFSRLGLSFETAPGVPMTASDADALMNMVILYEDTDHSGNFDRTYDTYIDAYISMALIDGSFVLNMPDWVAMLRVDYGTPRTYFVVLDIENNLASLGISQFQITHRTDPANGPAVSQTEDWYHDIVLDMEPAADVDSGWISLALFTDGFESGDASAWSSTVQ